MSGEQVGPPAIRKSWWRRLLCQHGQRSIWLENGRWHGRTAGSGISRAAALSDMPSARAPGRRRDQAEREGPVAGQRHYIAIAGPQSAPRGADPTFEREF